MKLLVCLVSAVMVSSLLLPNIAAATSCDEGCWVQVWEDENYRDDNDKICGPGKWSNLRDLPGANKNDWKDEIDSIKVGATAEVKVWEDEDYKDDSLTLKPGEEKPNLRGEPDLGDTIESMEIKCK